MITRINDFAVHYPCYFVAKKTWYIKKVPIPCVALEKRIQHVAFVRKRPWIVGEDQWGVSKESSAENICTLDDDLILFPNHAEDELCPILEDYKLHEDGNDGSKGIFLETHMEQCLWTNAPPPGGMPEFQGLRLLHVFSDMPRPPILRWSEEAVAHHEQLIDGVVNDGDSSSKEDISQINEVLQPSQYPVEPQETSELEEALNPTQTHDKVEAHKNSESATEDSTIISPHVSPKSWWNEWTDSLMGPQREYRYPSRFPVQTQDNESPMDELICPSPSVSSNSFFFETEFTDDGGLPSLDNTDQGSEPQWEGNDKGKSPSNQEPTKSSEPSISLPRTTHQPSPDEAGKGSEPLLEGKDQSMGKQGLNGLHATPSVPSPGTMHGLSLAGTGHGNEPLLVNGQPLPVPFVAGSQELVNLHVEHTLHYSRTVHQPSLDDTSHWSEPLLRQNDNDEPLGNQDLASSVVEHSSSRPTHQSSLEDISSGQWTESRDKPLRNQESTSPRVEAFNSETTQHLSFDHTCQWSEPMLFASESNEPLGISVPLSLQVRPPMTTRKPSTESMIIDSHQSSVSHVWFWTILLLCGLGGRMIRRQCTGTANRLVHAQPGLHVHALQYSQSFEQDTSSGEDRSLRSGESAATPVTSNLSKAETAADDNATLSENGSTGQARHGIGPPTRDNNGLEPTQMVPGVAVPDAITIRSNDMERLGNEAFLVLATDTRTPRRCNVGREQYYETEEAVETAPTEEQRSLLTVIALLALSGGGVSAKENVRGTLPVDSQSSETEKLDLHDHATIISMANAQSERDTTESSILECGTSMPVKGRVQYNSDEEQQEVLTATNDHGNLICTMNSRSDNDMDTSGGDGANSPVDTLFLASSIETNPSVGSTKYDNYRFASNDEADKSLTSWRGRNASYLYELENEVLEAGNRIDESLKEVLNMFEESLKPPSEVYTQVEEELSFAASDLSLHTNKLSVKGCHESDIETTGPDVFFECNPAMQGEHEPAAIEAPSLFEHTEYLSGDLLSASSVEADPSIGSIPSDSLQLTLSGDTDPSYRSWRKRHANFLNGLENNIHQVATQIDRSMQEVMNMSATQSLKGGDRHSDREEDVSLTDSDFFPLLNGVGIHSDSGSDIEITDPDLFFECIETRAFKGEHDHSDRTQPGLFEHTMHLPKDSQQVLVAERNLLQHKNQFGNLLASSSEDTNQTGGSIPSFNLHLTFSAETDPSNGSWRGRHSSFLHDLKNEVCKTANKINESLKDVVGTSISRASSKLSWMEEDESFQELKANQTNGSEKDTEEMMQVDDFESEPETPLPAAESEQQAARQVVAESDLFNRTIEAWSPVLPIETKTPLQRNNCLVLIQKLTRLSAGGTPTDQLLGFVEDWVVFSLSPFSQAPAARRQRLSFMIRDLYQFLQTKYELPASAVITLLPFLISTATVEDICCEERIGQLVFQAGSKFGDFFADQHSRSNTSSPSSTMVRPMLLDFGVEAERRSPEKQLAILREKAIMEWEVNIAGESANKRQVVSPRRRGFATLGKLPDKIPVHGSNRRQSPRSKDSFMYRERYLRAVLNMNQKVKEATS